MEEKLTEILECPICLDLPKNKVFQCRNGHTICQGCSKQAILCPICRDRYDLNKMIRNLKVEEILRRLKKGNLSSVREAPNKKNDGKEQKKNDFYFRHPTEFCKMVGFQTCSFASSDSAAIVKHLQKNHKMESVHQDALCKVVKPSIDVQGINPIVPLGLLESKSETFLVTMAISSTFKGMNCSFQAVHLAPNDNSTSQFECAFEIKDTTEKSVFSWKLVPTHFKSMERCFNEPPIQFPFSIFENSKFSSEPGILFNINISINSFHVQAEEPQQDNFILKQKSETGRTSSGLRVKPNSWNDIMVDGLLAEGHLKSPSIELAMRVVDRGNYIPGTGNTIEAFQNTLWKKGNLRLSAPRIYVEVLEALDVRPGHRLLTVGSGTGYFSTLCGVLIGKNGFNFALEEHSDAIAFAEATLRNFEDAVDESIDISLPIFTKGRLLDQDEKTLGTFDRIYCSTECSKDGLARLKKLLKINGLCIVHSTGDKLTKIRRIMENKFESSELMSAKFAYLNKYKNSLK